MRRQLPTPTPSTPSRCPRLTRRPSSWAARKHGVRAAALRQRRWHPSRLRPVRAKTSSRTTVRARKRPRRRRNRDPEAGERNRLRPTATTISATASSAATRGIAQQNGHRDRPAVTVPHLTQQLHEHAQRAQQHRDRQCRSDTASQRAILPDPRHDWQIDDRARGGRKHRTDGRRLWRQCSRRGQARRGCDSTGARHDSARQADDVEPERAQRSLRDGAGRPAAPGTTRRISSAAVGENGDSQRRQRRPLPCQRVRFATPPVDVSSASDRSHSGIVPVSRQHEGQRKGGRAKRLR